MDQRDPDHSGFESQGSSVLDLLCPLSPMSNTCEAWRLQEVANALKESEAVDLRELGERPRRYACRELRQRQMRGRGWSDQSSSTANGDTTGWG